MTPSNADLGLLAGPIVPRSSNSELAHFAGPSLPRPSNAELGFIAGPSLPRDDLIASPMIFRRDQPNLQQSNYFNLTKKSN